MKAKKLLALLLAAVMVLSMVACGGDSSPSGRAKGHSHIAIRVFLADFCISVLDTQMFSCYNPSHIKQNALKRKKRF